jgi:hypothetical protein
MKRAAVQRDAEMYELQMIRRGQPERLFPELFSDTWRKSIVSNWIDSVAREFSEMIAPLPALNCSARSMKTDADKRRASQKNVIGWHYWAESNLAQAMFSATDWYISYGFLPLYAEPCYDAGMPKIRAEDPVGFYFDKDRFGRVLRTAKCYKDTADRLCALFPDFEFAIRSKVDAFGNVELCAGDEKVEIVRYVDADEWVIFLPERNNLVVSRMANLTRECPFAVAERPGLFGLGENGGQFRDVIWVQLARARMALLGLEAGVKAVGAPIAVPRDVVEMAVGPDAVIQTERPQDVRRVGIEVPNSTFALQEVLESELRMGARYPEGRAGGIDASVITGRGVQALMGSFDTQISTAQTMIGAALAKVTEFAFEIDCTVWPSRKKRITGTAQGEPYDISYVPSKAIGDNYACDVSYGYAAGLSPNAAVVMLLQLRGDQIIDRSTLRKQLPFNIDDDRMQRALDVEQTQDALKQGLFGALANAGAAMAQGMDPRPLLRSAAEIIKGRQNGRELHELFIDAFAPETMDPEAAEAQAAAEADAEAGIAPAGPQAAPGQAQLGPGGLPDIQALVAGLRGGSPVMDATVSRRLPA